MTSFDLLHVRLGGRDERRVHQEARCAAFRVLFLFFFFPGERREMSTDRMDELPLFI